MEIKIFGTGCSRCNETEQLIKNVVAEQGIVASVLKVSDLKAIMQAGVLSPPAVSIDGKVMCTGKVPNKGEVESWLKNLAVPAETSPFAKPSPFAEPEGCACGGNCTCVDN